MSTSPFTSPTARALRQSAAEAIAEADRLDQEMAKHEQALRDARKPQMPAIPDIGAAFVTFTKYMSGREYTYAAVGWKIGRSVRWAITGITRLKTHGDDARFNWPGLLSFIGEANWSSIRPLTPGEPLIKPEDEPPVAEKMGQYGTVIGTADLPYGRGDFVNGPGYSGGRWHGGPS